MSHAIAYTEKCQLRMNTFDYTDSHYCLPPKASLTGVTQSNVLTFIDNIKQQKQDVYIQCGPGCVYIIPPKEGQILAARYVLKNAEIENINLSFSPGEMVIFTINLIMENNNPLIGKLINGEGWVMEPNCEWKDRELKANTEKLFACERTVTKAGFEYIGIDKTLLDKIPNGVNVSLTLHLHNSPS